MLSILAQNCAVLSTLTQKIHSIKYTDSRHHIVLSTLTHKLHSVMYTDSESPRVLSTVS